MTPVKGSRLWHHKYGRHRYMTEVHIEETLFKTIKKEMVERIQHVIGAHDHRSPSPVVPVEEERGKEVAMVSARNSSGSLGG